MADQHVGAFCQTLGLGVHLVERREHELRAGQGGRSEEEADLAPQAAESLRRAPGFNLLYVQVRDQFYLQAFYEGVLVKGVMLLARVAYYIDRYILSALYRLIAFVVEATAALTEKARAPLARAIHAAFIPVSHSIVLTPE